MIDGIHFEDHVVLVALGFENDGKKHCGSTVRDPVTRQRAFIPE